MLAFLVVGLAPFLSAPRALQDPAPGARLEFRTSPAIDLYHEVRFLAATNAAAPVAALAPALEAARELERELGPLSLAWGAFEGSLPGCERAADVLKVAERAPETVALPGGKTAEFRTRLVRMAQALAAAEPECAALLAENAATIELARASWEEL